MWFAVTPYLRQCVPADRARALARRIGRVLQAVGPRYGAELRVHDAGLDHRVPVVLVHSQNPIQPSQDHERRAFVRERAAREPRPRAARHERHAERGEQSYDGDKLFASAGENDEIRDAAMGR